MTAVPAVPIQALSAIRWRRRLSMIQDAALVLLSALFLSIQVQHVASGTYTSIPFAIEQAILVGIFLSRRRSVATSPRVFDWVVATGGGWLPLVLQPQEGAAAASIVGLGLQLAGLGISISCFGFLGRSFGIVAANRGLKTGGPYGLVRHPIYLGHTLSTVGFLIANWHPLNFALVVVVSACQLLRIRAEERVLTETAEYASYRGRVPWRLIPHVF